MATLQPEDITALLLALGVLLALARLLGELARTLGQPAVVGEILAGVVLGPTVLGAVSPAAEAALFPTHGGLGPVLDGIAVVSIVLFLLVAGMEVDLFRVLRLGRVAVAVSAGGLAVPFALGFAAVFAAPGLLRRQPGQDPLAPALFFAVALAISALPVIARTLLDLDLFRTDVGQVTVAAAMVDDLAGWFVFGIVLALMGRGGVVRHSVGSTIALTLGFALLMLTVGRWAIHRHLDWLHRHFSWPGGVLGFSLALAFFAAAFAEWIGVHAVFGSFLVGIALGDCEHFGHEMRETTERFASFLFAPLFFASIGLRVDFARSFDAVLVLSVLALACVGKFAGAGAAARLAGMPPREAWAVAAAMNARGGMEIILGLVALQRGVIGESLFVALVVMALVTSMLSGPLMQRLLRGRWRLPRAEPPR